MVSLPPQGNDRKGILKNGRGQQMCITLADGLRASTRVAFENARCEIQSPKCRSILQSYQVIVEAEALKFQTLSTPEFMDSILPDRRLRRLSRKRSQPNNDDGLMDLDLGRLETCIEQTRAEIDQLFIKDAELTTSHTELTAELNQLRAAFADEKEF